MFKMDAVKKVLKVSDLDPALAKQLTDNGFVNKSGEVCLSFLPPGSDDKAPVKKQYGIGKPGANAEDHQRIKDLINKALAKQGKMAPGYGGSDTKLEPAPKAASAALKRVFKDNATKRPERFKKSGLIDFKRLSRVSFTDRIFKHRNKEVAKQNYAVHLLVDCSGSMNETDPASVIYRTAANLIYDLKDIAKMSLHAVTGKHTQIKGLDMPATFEHCQVYYQALLDVKQFGDGSTYFESSLKAAENIIKGHRDKHCKHIVILFTDGGTGGDFDTLKSIVRDISRIASFEAVGICVRKGSIKDLSKMLNDCLGFTPPFLDKLEDMYDYVANQLKKRLVRRM